MIINKEDHLYRIRLEASGIYVAHGLDAVIAYLKDLCRRWEICATDAVHILFDVVPEDVLHDHYKEA